MEPDKVLTEVGSSLAAVIRDIEVLDPVQVDQYLGYALYMAQNLGDGTRILTTPLIDGINNLRRRLTSALVKPLWPNEKAGWVRNLDDLSSKAFIAGNQMTSIMDNVRAKGDARKQARETLHHAGDWQDKLAIVQNVMKIPAPAKVPDQGKLAEQVASTVILRSNSKQETPEWWNNELAKMDRNKIYGSAFLPQETTFGITQHSITVIPVRSPNPSTLQMLAARGITTDTVFSIYMVLNNCRLLGVLNTLLPGHGPSAEHVARFLLGKVQDTGLVKEYSLAQVTRKMFGNHTYFPLLPNGCDLPIKTWEFVKTTASK